MERRETRKVLVGDVPIGGGEAISVQSMTKTRTEDTRATVDQIRRLELAGCEIVRVAVPDSEAASALKEIRTAISIPLVADIHFHYKLALEAIQAGADKLRINPGNIGAKWKVEEIVRAARERKIPLRIGVNAGSLWGSPRKKHRGAGAQALVESASRCAAILEDLDFHDVVVSLKSSDIPTTIRAYQLMSGQNDYPLHLGVTEAGLPLPGSVRSAVGIGSLLSQGIGDTLRVSLTGDPVMEVEAGFEILKSLGLREHGPTVIACPTCGRSEVDLISLAEEVERRVRSMRKPLKIAVMGCVVNGPGEAQEADVGIAGGKGAGLVFRRGEVVRKVGEESLVEALLEEIERLT